MSFTHDELHELPVVISAPRFATYLRARHNDREKALALYHWNLMLSAAFMVPLQVCEVAVRNAVVEVLEKVHGPNWPWSNGFIRSLPRPRNARAYNPAANLQDVASRLPTSGKVVADLNFAFWATVLTVGQDARLWIPHFGSAFPGAPSTLAVSVARAKAYDDLQAVRLLRNRIAHHEPIFSRNITAEYDRLHRLVGWRSPVAAAWMDRHQGVTSLIPLEPK